MSEYSTKLSLPYIAPAQAQKHITHNEALRLLDAIVQLSVRSRSYNSPPEDSQEEDCYIVALDASGAWDGWDNHVARLLDGVWQRIEPQKGWCTWNEDEAILMVFDGDNWINITSKPLQGISSLGIGTQADQSTPFSAKLNSTLWTAKTLAEGGNGNLFQNMCKEGKATNLGILLKSGDITKAIIGLLGTDQLKISVSNDGSAFREAILVDETSGIVDQPNLPRFKAHTNYDNYVDVNSWTKIGINICEYNEQNVFDPASNLFTAPITGTYLFGATLLFKINASLESCLEGRMVVNQNTILSGSFGEISGNHVSEKTHLSLLAMAILNEGDSVELQGNFRAYDGYFAADQTVFWGMKIG